MDHSVGEDRSQAWRTALRSAGVEPEPHWFALGGFLMPQAKVAALAMLRSARPPTAIFAGSDEMAFGAMLAAAELGLRVPEDLSVIGIDDHDWSESFGLTTVQQDPREQGRVAARSVVGRALRRGAGRPTRVTDRGDRARGAAEHRAAAVERSEPGAVPRRRCRRVSGSGQRRRAARRFGATARSHAAIRRQEHQHVGDGEDDRRQDQLHIERGDEEQGDHHDADPRAAVSAVDAEREEHEQAGDDDADHDERDREQHQPVLQRGHGDPVRDGGGAGPGDGRPDLRRHQRREHEDRSGGGQGQAEGDVRRSGGG